MHCDWILINDPEEEKINPQHTTEHVLQYNQTTEKKPLLFVKESKKCYGLILGVWGKHTECHLMAQSGFYHLVSEDGSRGLQS